MPLSGNIPTQEEQRLKVYFYGPPGGGKTLAALQFTNSYIIDTAKETSRYAKLIQNKNSHVFYCSDFYKVKKELEILRDEPHNFQTLVIDEISTLYQKLQRLWTDKFIKALEAKKAKHKMSEDDNLLEDFGFRYWDKVKRDWKDFIDVIRQLDMNVIVTAHQKNKYGMAQQITGVTSDSDKDDEYVWDFVFHIIKRGKEYKAVTEKQRVLPKEIDPNAKRFPDEFHWNYDNIIKFYEKEYIERPTRNSSNVIPENKNKNTLPLEPINSPSKKVETVIESKQKKQTPQPKKENEIEPTSNSTKDNINNIDKIKSLLKKENITIKDFKIFLQNVCKWRNATMLANLTKKQQENIISHWKDRVLPKYKESKGIKNIVSKETVNEVEKKIENKPKEQLNPNGSITEKQRKELLSKLEENDIEVERFFKGFTIKSWNEITQEGAANMIKNFDVMIGAL